MITKNLRFFVLAVLLAGFAASLAAADAQPEDAAFAKKIMAAIEHADYAAFVADGEPAFSQLKKEQFDAVAAQLAPKLKAGSEVSYLGELKQRGYRVSLWKVTFKDGSDDALATLSVKEGKVGGFWIR